MTSTLTHLTSPRAEPPHLPPVARDPVDDAREIVAALKAAGEEANVSADELVTVLRHLVALTERPKRPQLTGAAALCVDQAELFMLSLDGEDLNADGGRRPAYLLGLAEAHLVSLVAILRAVTK